MKIKYRDELVRIDMPGIIFITRADGGKAGPILISHGIKPHISAKEIRSLELIMPGTDSTIPPIPMYAHSSQEKS
ncbi:MAG: hypothetical protein JRJ65_02870 [Deltaproteobacteria bacterium]|nr:hypothetical protein [Deltaproteobacteria bacterium]